MMNINQTQATPPGAVNQPPPGAPGEGVSGARSRPANPADAERFGSLIQSGDADGGADTPAAPIESGDRLPNPETPDGLKQPGAATGGVPGDLIALLKGDGMRGKVATPGGLINNGGGQPGRGEGEGGRQPVQEGMSGLFSQAASSLAEAMGGASQSGADAAAASDRAVSRGAGVQAPAGLSSLNCDDLVERILVSRPSSAEDSSEVRIRVNEPWLRDTEIRVAKTPDAALTVEFMTDDVDAQRTLLPNLSELRGRLADRTGEQVTVRMTEQMTRDGDGRDRPGDGRSRNRRNLYEEMGESR